MTTDVDPNWRLCKSAWRLQRTHAKAVVRRDDNSWVVWTWPGLLPRMSEHGVAHTKIEAMRAAELAADRVEKRVRAWYARNELRRLQGRKAS